MAQKISSRYVDKRGRTREIGERVHPSDGRIRELTGKHSARCKAGKHEDWQHGVAGCAVGPQGAGHCDCEAHWREVQS